MGNFFEKPEKEDVINVCLVGKPNVGKTQFYRSFVYNRSIKNNYRLYKSTTSLTYHTISLHSKKLGKDFNIKLWDLPSKINYDIEYFFRKADYIIYLYRPTKDVDFNMEKEYYQKKLKKHNPKWIMVRNNSVDQPEVLDDVEGFCKHFEINLQNYNDINFVISHIISDSENKNENENPSDS